MTIDFSIELPLELKVVVEDVDMGNTGIGYYEYQGRTYFDHGEDYVESFHITELYFVFEGKEVEIKDELFKMINDMLEKDEDFKTEIERQVSIDRSGREIERNEFYHDDR